MFALGSAGCTGLICLAIYLHVNLSTCFAAVLLLKIYQEWKYFWRNLKGGNLCVSWLAILSSSRTDSQFLESRRMCRVPTSMWDDSRVPFYAAAYLMTYMDSENIKKKNEEKKWINENICHLGKSSWLSVTGAFSCLLDTLLKSARKANNSLFVGRTSLLAFNLSESQFWSYMYEWSSLGWHFNSECQTNHKGFCPYLITSLPPCMKPPTARHSHGMLVWSVVLLFQ